MIYSFIMFIQCSNSAVALWAPGIDMLHLTDLGDLADALGYKQMWKNPAFPRKIIYRWVFQTWVFRRVLCWQEETAYERDDILALCNGIKTPPCLSPASFNHRIAACEKTLHRPRPKKNERTWKHHFDSAVEVCQSNLPSSLLLLSLALHLTAFVAHLPFPMAWEASWSRNVKKLLQMSVTFCIYTTI